MDLTDLRRDYAEESLTERDVDPDPIRQFEKWFEQALRAGMVEPNAMTVATSTRDGHPSARMILLKGFDANGFVFFTARPDGSRIGAWASQQSAPLESRETLEREVERLRRAHSEDVPLPPHWGGYRVTPEWIEFWQGRPSRLHDRIVNTRDGEGLKIGRLSP